MIQVFRKSTIRVEHEKCSEMCVRIVRFGLKLRKWDHFSEKVTFSQKKTIFVAISFLKTPVYQQENLQIFISRQIDKSANLGTTPTLHDYKNSQRCSSRILFSCTRCTTKSTPTTQISQLQDIQNPIVQQYNSTIVKIFQEPYLNVTFWDRGRLWPFFD